MPDTRQRRKSAGSNDRQPYIRNNLAVQPEIEHEQQDPLKVLNRRVESRVEENRLGGKIYTGRQILIAALALALILLTGSFFLMPSLDLRANKMEAARLEKEYQEIVQDNALLKNSCESNIDYNGIYEFALLRGMSAPEKQQILTYKRSNPEYVSKNGEIPNE